MNYILLMAVVIGVSVQQISKKAYSVKQGGGALAFSAASAAFALIFFIITSGGQFKFDINTMWYAVAFAVTYIVAIVGSMLAIKNGPLSLSSLVTSYSLIIPTFYGIFVLGEKSDMFLAVGIILLLASVFFINMEKKGEEKKITFRWVVFVLLGFIGNGVCSTVQKVHQSEFGGMYKNEFMIIALIAATAVLFVFAGVAEKKQMAVNLKKGFLMYAICGLANGAVNYLVLILSNKMPASVMFPVISAGGVVLAALVAVFVYKEKLSYQQWLGMLLGTGAIIFLNL